MATSLTNHDQVIAGLHDRFIDMLYVTHGLTTPEVEAAFRAVPRHLFVDQYYVFGKRRRLIRVDPKRPTTNQLKKIYSDEALVSHQDPPSSTSQPSLVAQMLEALQLHPGFHILEIGAGTGWNAALLGHLAGPSGHVHSIDIQADVARRARRHIRRLRGKNVTIITGDGGRGYRQAAPYERIVTTVSCPDISPHWMHQLKDGGMLLITLGFVPGDQRCLLPQLWKRHDHLEGRIVGHPGFMSLRGQYGADVAASPEQLQGRRAQITAGRRARKREAPWACWNPRMRHEVRHNLIFFASLEGMQVEPLGPQYALYDHLGESVCITDDAHLMLYGSEASYRRLEDNTRKWIDLGAPHRGAYLVEVWPKHVQKKPPKHGWLTQRRHTQLIFRLRKE